MTRNLNAKIVLAATAALAAACESNPFPQEGRITPTKPDVPKRELPPLGLDLPQVMDFAEGAEGEYTIQTWVPAGSPVLTFEGLPAGAQFDDATSTLRWTPGFDAANDAKRPGSTTRLYPVRLQLTSSLDPLTVAYREVTLLVTDTPRVDRVEVSGRSQVDEGQEIVQTVRIESPDYPQGPFTLAAKGLPVAATVEKQGESAFVVRYRPGFGEVRSRGSFSRRSIEYVVLGPNGIATPPQRTEWQVRDVDQPARLAGPAEVSQGMTAAFTLLLEDINGEGAPTLSTPSVRFGTIQSTLLSGVGAPAGGNPVAAYEITWRDIPPAEAGKAHVLTFSACNSRSSCFSRPVTVRFSADSRPSPRFERDQWPLGATPFVRAGESILLRLPVVPGDRNDAIERVEVRPAELASEVRWSANVVRISPSTAGVKQFTLRAVTRQGAHETEAFTFEALSPAWSPVLILGDTLRDPEVSRALFLFPGAAVVSPDTQALDARALALRRLVLLGTSAIRSVNRPAIETALSRLPANLVVASPAIDELQGELAAELKDGGLIPAGKPFEVDSTTVVSPVPGTGLATPLDPVVLSGQATSLSSRPMTLAFAARPRCEATFHAFHGSAFFTVGALCPNRADNRKVLVTGFEWADAVFGTRDAGLNLEWINQLVNE
jgi:hypothetical protein